MSRRRQSPRASIWLVTMCLTVLSTSAAIPAGAANPAPGTPDAVAAAPPVFVQADLFFISWSTETRTRQSPADVRRHPDVTIQLKDAACVARLLTSLRLSELVKTPAGAAGDARLVIDLRAESGTGITVYADQFSLMTEDSSSRRPIDQRFKDTVGTAVFLGTDPWCKQLP